MKCKTTAIKLLKLKLTDVFSSTHNRNDYIKEFVSDHKK